MMSKYIQTLAIATGAQCSIVDYDSVRSLNSNVTPVSKPLISLGLNRPEDGCSVEFTLMLPSADYVNVNMFCVTSVNVMCILFLLFFLCSKNL